MNKFKIMALSLFVGVLGTSCADMLDDNVSSDKSKGITAEIGLPTIVYYAAQTNYDHAVAVPHNNRQIVYRCIWLQERLGILDYEPSSAVAPPLL